MTVVTTGSQSRSPSYLPGSIDCLALTTAFGSAASVGILGILSQFLLPILLRNNDERERAFYTYDKQQKKTSIHACIYHWVSMPSLPYSTQPASTHCTLAHTPPILHSQTLIRIILRNIVFMTLRWPSVADRGIFQRLHTYSTSWWGTYARYLKYAPMIEWLFDSCLDRGPFI